MRRFKILHCHLWNAKKKICGETAKYKEHIFGMAPTGTLRMVTDMALPQNYKLSG